MRLLHRLSAVLLCLGLIAGNAAICAGWAAAPEARMACCTDDGNCSMHTRESGDSGSGRALTQAQVARLDAVSETRPIYPYWHQRNFAERNPPPVPVAPKS